MRGVEWPYQQRVKQSRTKGFQGGWWHIWKITYFSLNSYPLGFFLGLRNLQSLLFQQTPSNKSTFWSWLRKYNFEKMCEKHKAVLRVCKGWRREFSREKNQWKSENNNPSKNAWFFVQISQLRARRALARILRRKNC